MVSSPIRLIAVDLDGTLLNSRSELSPANRNALAEAAERGVEIVVVTGRRFHSALPFVAQIPRPVTLISSNGARISSALGEVFHRNFLSWRVARQVLAATRAYRPYAVAIYDQSSRGQVTMQENAVPEGPLGWYLKNYPNFLLQVADLEAAVISDPIQIMFGGPPAAVAPIEPLLRSSAAASSIHLTWTKYLTRDVSILDVMAGGCSKGAALEIWARRCGVPPEEIMAVGDNFNDVEMLEFAGRAVVMGNRSAGLEREGWHVTLGNDEDGVAVAIERFVLNTRR